MNTYTATAPNGKVIVKKTKNTYTHAALQITYSGEWKIAHASSSKEGALKMAAAYDTPLTVVELQTA